MRSNSVDPNRDHFDLLPFIAVMLCTFGCLLFVTMGVAAFTLGPAGGEIWVPSKTNMNVPGSVKKQPLLIEWDGQTAVIHDPLGKRSVQWQPDGPLPNELASVVDMLSTHASTEYALFAVRPSGFANFNQLAQIFRDRSITVGYEPIEQPRPVQMEGEDRL